MKVEELVKQYLEEGRMMQVATVESDQPWCCTVFYVPNGLNVFWISLPGTRHSKEIHKHAKVAATIPIQHTPGDDVIGMQIEGDAKLVEDKDEISHVIKLYAERYMTGAVWYNDFIAGNNPHKLYRITPRLFVIFDEKNFPENSRREWRP